MMSLDVKYGEPVMLNEHHLADNTDFAKLNIEVVGGVPYLGFCTPPH